MSAMQRPSFSTCLTVQERRSVVPNGAINRTQAGLCGRFRVKGEHFSR